MKVPALALPVLVDTFTRSGGGGGGYCKYQLRGTGTGMVAGTPFTVMVLLIAVALNPVPTIVTLDPTVPLEGVMLEIVTVLPPLVVGVNTITGSSCVLSFVDADDPHDKINRIPAATACVKEYGYDTPYVIVCGPNFAVLEL